MNAWIFSVLLAAASSVQGQYLTVPADAIPADDPRIGAGHDAIRLLSAAMKLKPKSEFESTADFQARRTAFAATPVYGSVTLNGKVAIRLGPIAADRPSDEFSYRYDADAGTLSVCMPGSGGRYVDLGTGMHNSAAVWVWHKVTKTGSYVGRNAFGARAVVQKQQLIGARLLIPIPRYPNVCATAIEMSTAEARASLSSAALTIVGRFLPPFGSRHEDFDKATLDDPVEQVSVIDEVPFLVEELVLSTRGRILYRKPAPEF